MARLTRSLWYVAIALVMTGGCAVVGYDFDDYEPASAGGAGGTGQGSGASTSASGTSTGSGSSASGTASTTGSGGGSGENCVNGTDDDNDGQTDCEDTDCPGFTCVEAAPAGWSGPVAFWQGQGAPPACSPGTAPLTQGGTGPLNAPPASCLCGCSTPQGTTCTNMDVTFHSNDECSMIAETITAVNGVCTATPNNMLSASGSALTVINTGSCQPTPSTSVPTAAFDQSALVCGGALLAAGCGGGQVCAPVVASPFAPSYCIYQTGDAACPSTGYTVKNTLYKSITDSRGCGTCSCGGPNVQCTGTTSFYMDACISNPYHSVFACSGGIAASGYMKYVSNVTGACTPSGGMPIGTAQGDAPVTVCCPP